MTEAVGSQMAIHDAPGGGGCARAPGARGRRHAPPPRQPSRRAASSRRRSGSSRRRLRLRDHASTLAPWSPSRIYADWLPVASSRSTGRSGAIAARSNAGSMKADLRRARCAAIPADPPAGIHDARAATRSRELFPTSRRMASLPSGQPRALRGDAPASGLTAPPVHDRAAFVRRRSSGRSLRHRRVRSPLRAGGPVAQRRSSPPGRRSRWTRAALP